MIDPVEIINEALRRAGKMPPMPKVYVPPSLYDALKRGGDVNMAYIVRQEPIPTPLDLRRRPDGVWEMPK